MSEQLDSLFKKISDIYEKKDKERRKIKNRIKRFFEKLKCFWDKKTRGWSPEDMLNLDVHFAEIILPRLKYFKQYCAKVSCGCCYNEARVSLGFSPRHDSIETEEGVDSEEVWALAKKIWENKLDKMIDAFEFMTSDEYYCFNKEKQEKMEEGKQLFIDYMGAMWY